MVRVRRDRRIMGESFTKFHFPRIPRSESSPPLRSGACLTRIFATLLLYNSRTDALSLPFPSPTPLFPPLSVSHLSGSSHIIVEGHDNTVTRGAPTGIDPIDNFSPSFPSPARTCAAGLLFSTSRGNFRGLSIKRPFSGAWLTRLKVSGEHIRFSFNLVPLIWK